ncbi:DUF1643 domain-containing protein [Micromonospora aurantiaca (nom. illeg.)]|uniref:DUF1643 domain-containing protein n=1 Tax=Micromonospora aurantiaca (nom. illeg.) TaxID=47850 RepID=UPI0033C14562
MGDLVTERHAPVLGESATALFGPAAGCAAHPAPVGTDCVSCHPYRYALTRTWDARLAPATFVMLNPSTADAVTDDATIRRCVGYARTWGCGGIAVYNLFALRSRDPDVLAAHPDPVGPANDAVICAWAQQRRQDDRGPVVAAWGSHRRHRARAAHVTGLLLGLGIGLTCLATTRDGQPRHPLYLRRDL